MTRGVEILTDDEKAEFRLLWDSGVSVAAIAKRFGRGETVIKVWRDLLGCQPRRESNSGKQFGFELSEEQIYAQAAELRAKWPAWRTPLYACSTSRGKRRNP